MKILTRIALFFVLVSLSSFSVFAESETIKVTVEVSKFSKVFHMSGDWEKSSGYPIFRELSYECTGTYRFESYSKTYRSGPGSELPFTDSGVLTELQFQDGQKSQHLSLVKLSNSSGFIKTEQTRLRWQTPKGAYENIRLDKEGKRKGWRDLAAGKVAAYGKLSVNYMTYLYADVIRSIAKEVAESLKEQGLQYSGNLEEALKTPSNQSKNDFLLNSFLVSEDMFTFKLEDGLLKVNFPAGTFKTEITVNVLPSKKESVSASEQEAFAYAALVKNPEVRISKPRAQSQQHSKPSVKVKKAQVPPLSLSVLPVSAQSQQQAGNINSIEPSQFHDPFSRQVNQGQKMGNYEAQYVYQELPEHQSHPKPYMPPVDQYGRYIESEW